MSSLSSHNHTCSGCLPKFSIEQRNLKSAAASVLTPGRVLILHVHFLASFLLSIFTLSSFFCFISYSSLHKFLCDALRHFFAIVIFCERTSAKRKSVTFKQIVRLIDENRFAKTHTISFHFQSGGTTVLRLFIVQKSRELTRVVYFYVYACTCETYAARTRSAIKLRVWKVSRWKIVKKSARALALACVCVYARIPMLFVALARALRFARYSRRVTAQRTTSFILIDKIVKKITSYFAMGGSYLTLF